MKGLECEVRGISNNSPFYLQTNSSFYMLDLSRAMIQSGVTGAPKKTFHFFDKLKTIGVSNNPFFHLHRIKSFEILKQKRNRYYAQQRSNFLAKYFF